MKVVYPVIRGSGVSVYTERLIAGLAALNVAGKVVSFSPHWEYLPWGLKWAWSRAGHCAQECSVVHVNADYGHFFRVPGRPLVATLHHSAIDAAYLASLSATVRLHHRWILRPAVAKTMDLADALVTVSQHTRATLCEVFQKDFAMRVIPNGIDVRRFYPVPQEQRDGTGPAALFFSGNLSHRKGADLFVPVMKELGKDFLLRVTSGLRGSAGRFLEAPNIQCLGRLSEEALIREINRADMAFQPSRREGFGLSILEAMACGKPVVSTNDSAIPEVLVQGEGGYLCEPGSVDQLVSAIRRLADSASLRSRMGQFNRRRVEEKFTLDKMAKEYYSLYESLEC